MMEALQRLHYLAQRTEVNKILAMYFSRKHFVRFFCFVNEVVVKVLHKVVELAEMVHISQKRHFKILPQVSNIFITHQLSRNETHNLHTSIDKNSNSTSSHINCQKKTKNPTSGFHTPVTICSNCRFSNINYQELALKIFSN